MNKLYNTRRTFAPLVTTAKGILYGLITHQENIGVKYNTTDQFNPAISALCGVDGESGSEGLYNLAATIETEKSQAFKVAARSAYKLARSTVNVLKNELGEQFGPAWQPVGFSRSLAIPKDPGPVLILMGAYLKAHPTLEFAAQDVTEAKLNEAVQNLDHARQAKTEASSLAKAAMAQRDLDREALYQRVLAFHRELVILLPADDPRWLSFGFMRPIDGKIPTPITELTAKQGLPGEIQLTWAASVRAKGYRVQWHLKATPEEMISVGLTAEREITLHNLPGTAEIVVLVSAYNKSGETKPATLEVTVG